MIYVLMAQPLLIMSGGLEEVCWAEGEGSVHCVWVSCSQAADLADICPESLWCNSMDFFLHQVGLSNEQTNINKGGRMRMEKELQAAGHT